MSDPQVRDEELLRRLHERDARKTVVVLRDGRHLIVFNIAWGYDIGDEWAHVTTNISPSSTGIPIDFFYTSDVALVIDPATDRIVYSTADRRPI